MSLRDVDNKDNLRHFLHIALIFRGIQETKLSDAMMRELYELS